MAKRSSKTLPSGVTTARDGSTVLSLFPNRSGWDPLGGSSNGGAERRDQSYLRTVKPQNTNQKALMDAIAAHHLVVAIGPAGTGKTYLAVSAAVDALERGQVDRIVLSRPALEAGESIGFLPGDLHEKMAPFLRPLTDALSERMGAKRLRALMADGTIEVAPIGYMRGRTLNNAFVVIDEAQNCTYAQIKMLLTRLGWHSTMVLTGDPDQTDLLDHLSGLSDIAQRLDAVDGIAVVRLTEGDIVRHPLVASMLTVL
ncbi:PhoH family protein [Azospirillum griseum]|uniref:PhoH-like protein n=1 Tax=Azospirillum griseum TaxID=2496639 RepID=A0A431VAC9_9PROT|nr:PhoH family protein [Azospirillum griseum]RTR13473.1 PhoH family protein [Azospirillum griseum]